jgi:hypothetical protein
LKFKKQIKQLLTNELFALFCLVVIFLIRQISTISFDLQMGDEGIVVSVFKRVFQGNRLYEEVWYGYGPIAPYFFSMIFYVFGMSLMVVRYAATFLLTVGLIASFFICRRLMTLWWSVVAALISYLMVFQPIYSYSNIFALIGGLYGIYFLIKFADKRSYWWIFYSGFSIGLTILQKPIPLGGAMWFALLVSIVLYWKLHDKKLMWDIKKIVLLYFLGSGIVVVPVYTAIIIFNSIDTLTTNFLFFLGYYGGYPNAFEWPNIFRYSADIFQSNSVLTLYYSIKNTYYSLCYYLPIIMGLGSILYVLKHKNRPESFMLLVLSVFSPLLFLQFYYTGGGIGHGEMSLILPTTIIMMIYFITKFYNFAILKVNKFIVYTLLVIGLLCFYIMPSLYLFRPDIRERTLTVQALNGIRVSKEIYNALQLTTEFIMNTVSNTVTIATVGSEADIFNVILDNPNAFGVNHTYWRQLYNNEKIADDIFNYKLLPILEAKKPSVIIVDRREVPGKEVNRYLKKNYELSFQTGDILGIGEPYKDYHYYQGYRVFLRKN